MKKINYIKLLFSGAPSVIIDDSGIGSISAIDIKLTLSKNLPGAMEMYYMCDKFHLLIWDGANIHTTPDEEKMDNNTLYTLCGHFDVYGVCIYYEGEDEPQEIAFPNYAFYDVKMHDDGALFITVESK